MERPVFRTRDLTRLYRTGEVEVRALDGVDIELPEGETTVLLGPSGSGKSTFLNIVGGLDRPTGGTVHFKDRELTALGERELTRYRRDHVGFVFQFYNLIPSLTAWKNVALTTEIARDPMTPDAALAFVGLQERKHHFPAQLSGGEQQRVATARAIAKRSEVLLCDEPTGALDSKTGIRVLEALAKINDELSTTVVIIPTRSEQAVSPGTRIAEVGDPGNLEIVVDLISRSCTSVTWWRTGASLNRERTRGDAARGRLLPRVLMKPCCRSTATRSAGSRTGAGERAERAP